MDIRNIDTPEDFTFRKYIERVIDDVEKKFPRRPYKASQSMGDVMEVEGQQQVINYLKNKYKV